MDNHQLFTRVQLEDYLSTVAERTRKIHQAVLDKGPAFIKPHVVSGKAEEALQRRLDHLRKILQTPVEKRLEETLLYWLVEGGSGLALMKEMTPWCGLALVWLREGEFHAAVSVVLLMREHFDNAGPESLDVLEGDYWADFTPRRGRWISKAIREMATRAVQRHPAYRTKAERDAEAERELEDYIKTRTT